MTLLIQHGFAGLSGVGDDHYVNTFHMSTVGVADLSVYWADFVEGTSGLTNGEQLAALFRGFYVGHASESTLNPMYFLSQAIASEGEFFKIYDLDAAPHSPPVFSYLYPDVVDPPSAAALPSEVAVCLTVEAYATGVLAGTGAGSKARRRNRIYFGPLNHNAEASSTSTGSSRPTSNLREALCREWVILRDSMDSYGWALVVYSKSDDVEETPTRLWVDDAWDTQRRRGQEASGRTVQIV